MVKQSPLYKIQQKFGATFTEFAGFKMPVQYSSIKDEHLAVRTSVGLFDVSHMSNIWVKGPDAGQLLSLTTLEDPHRIIDKKSQYTAILRENGTIIDDTIFMHLNDKFMVIPNAGMDEIVTLWFKKQAVRYNLDVNVENVSKDYVILAVQGPKSRDTLQKVTDIDLSHVGFFDCTQTMVSDVNCIVSHTGYTGELGFELQITPTEKAEQVFFRIMEAGNEFSIKPIGLGARDTLRLEKCFLLAGNEFEGGRTPLETGLSWAINWDHNFIGKEALLKQKESGDYPRLTCLECTERGIPRHGCEVKKDTLSVGVVSSGSMSPCLNTGIAMAYVDPSYRDIDLILDIDIRGKLTKAKVIKPPFVKQDWIKTKRKL
jgi:aminomethyltransferase